MKFKFKMMQTYIVLLRGINVGGHKKIKMAELRSALERVGFQSVSTYIQSGNIVLRHSDPQELVASRIARCIKNDFGHEVPVVVYLPEEWNTMMAQLPFALEEADTQNFYFIFLFDRPDKGRINALESESFPHEKFHIRPGCIYLMCEKGYGKAKCNNNFFEKRLKVQATARNLRTVNTLSQMAGDLPDQ